MCATLSRAGPTWALTKHHCGSLEDECAGWAAVHPSEAEVVVPGLELWQTLSGWWALISGGTEGGNIYSVKPEQWRVRGSKGLMRLCCPECNKYPGKLDIVPMKMPHLLPSFIMWLSLPVVLETSNRPLKPLCGPHTMSHTVWAALCGKDSREFLGLFMSDEKWSSSDIIYFPFLPPKKQVSKQASQRQRLWFSLCSSS